MIISVWKVWTLHPLQLGLRFHREETRKLTIVVDNTPLSQQTLACFHLNERDSSSTPCSFVILAELPGKICPNKQNWNYSVQVIIDPAQHEESELHSSPKLCRNSPLRQRRWTRKGRSRDMHRARQTKKSMPFLNFSNRKYFLFYPTGSSPLTERTHLETWTVRFLKSWMSENPLFCTYWHNQNPTFCFSSSTRGNERNDSMEMTWMNPVPIGLQSNNRVQQPYQESLALYTKLKSQRWTLAHENTYYVTTLNFTRFLFIDGRAIKNFLERSEWF